MKGPATELIHAGETNTGDVVPLTTPIYETATFVFENANEVLEYNEGRSSKYLYSRYANPTIVSVERKLAALDRTEEALLFSSGQGATTTLLMALALMLVFEGVLPFIAPNLWRETFRKITQMSDGQIRFVGLSSMLVGLLLLLWVST